MSLVTKPSGRKSNTKLRVNLTDKKSTEKFLTYDPNKAE